MLVYNPRRLGFTEWQESQHAKSGGRVMTSRLAFLCGCRNDSALCHQHARLGADLRSHQARSRLGVSRRARARDRQGRTPVRRQRRGRRALRGRSRQRHREDRNSVAGRHGGRHRVRARRHHGVDRLPDRRPLRAQGRRPDQEARLRPARHQLAGLPQGRPAVRDAGVPRRRAVRNRCRGRKAAAQDHGEDGRPQRF